MDVSMPVMDGFEFRREQEQDAKLASIPVVIMTADGHIELKSKKIGANAFIRKPLDIDTVIHLVRKYSV